MIQTQAAQTELLALADAELNPVAETRVLHLVDVENLAGAADFSQIDAARIHQAYAQVAPRGAIDQVVLATSHHAALPAWRAWPESARRLVRSGPNGADLALLQVLECESVASRFAHVVVGSGDGIFAFEAARLQAAGIRVTVVTRRGALSRRLRFAVRDVRYIDPSVRPALVFSAEAP
jgi:hypothetical protein